jgi:predicted phosphoribosyltransferase/pimeloyl-ACP methyl ester carboxylesterase
MAFRTRTFADRADAARQLAVALASYKGTNPLVLGIPRGGMPIGRILADALGGELDIVLVRKIGAPFNPEYAIGAVDERGTIQLEPHVRSTHADAAFVRDEAARQIELIRERRKRYSPQRAPIDPAGRTVIVVDDGLATGATMRAALSSVRARHPARLVCAVPVAAPESLESMEALCDDIVCLVAPRDFQAVGQYYQDFLPVEDAEVVTLLRAPSRPHAPVDRQVSRHVRIPAGGIEVEGDLDVPDGAKGLVVFAHGSGSGRMSPRNRFVARILNEAGLATLLCDLLAHEEDTRYAARFDIALLADRLDAIVGWTQREHSLNSLPIGLFGASTGAAAALVAAARQPDVVKAVVSRGGRPDLAGRAVLARVSAPTLLIVGGADREVLTLNECALGQMPDAAMLTIVPDATHLFEEPGALENAAALAARWFERHLAGPPSAGVRSPRTAEREHRLR